MKANIPSRVLSINDMDPPWIARQITFAIKRKRRVFRKFMNSGRKQEDWENFKIIRNETSIMVASANKQYYSNLGQKPSDPTTGIKAFWSTMNKLIYKKTNVPPLLENRLFVANIKAKANVVNEYSVQMCSESSTSSTLQLLYQGVKSVSSGSPFGGRMFCNLFDLWIATAPIAMIKICAISIVEHLCLIFEDCLQVGMYPCLWKKANIVPIHKKERRMCKTNYRPISVLPVFE